jgi:Stage II sporulation protein E (SpoIIE)/Winged helix-turn helix
MRRCQALLARSRGEYAPKIAESLGCGQQTVSDAIHDFNERGLDALVARSSRHKRTRDAFDEESVEAMKRMLHRSPREFGYDTSLWSLEIAAQAAFDELRARGMPLGLMPGMEYEEKEVVLKKGESALFYSDGLVEAHDPHYEMFGFPRLRELLADHGEERSLVEFLIEELSSFTGPSWEQEDDITLMTLQRSAAHR